MEINTLVDITGPTVEVRTRNGANASTWWPEICAGLANLSKTRTVLDGEACVLDELGRSDFTRMLERSRRRRWYRDAPPVVFIAFDILIDRGVDVRAEPLRHRKVLLAQALRKQRPNVLLCQHLPGEQAPDLYEAAVQLKLEGIVVKQLESPYVGGEPRTGHWVKIKRPGATPAQRFTRDTDLELGC